MNENAKQLTSLFCLLLVFLSPSQILDLKQHELEAATHQIKTLDKILEKRQNFFNRTEGRGVNRLVNILIVPGHDDESWGAEFQGVKEVQLNRELAQKLHTYLSQEKGINAVLASDESGYNYLFEKYFEREEKNIKDFIEGSKKTFSKRVKKEEIENIETNFHNVASESVAYRLYGINKWVNAQNFDLVIHIHFNDYRGRKSGEEGEHTGFSIYTPGKLFANHELSREFADAVFDEVKKIQSVSTLKSESEGVIEGHELIALGANESLEAGSILVEYGYIYENNFIDPEKRQVALDNFAYATYAGIKELMNEQPIVKSFEDVAIIENKNTLANLKWQFQKALKGEYPPKDKTLNDCPITGYFGECSMGVK